jgi:hypothetical protein
MAKQALNLAKIILDAEPDAALGDLEAVHRVTAALAKVSGALLSAILVGHGERAFQDAVANAAKSMELEARQTASMVTALEEDSGDPPGRLN